MRIPPRWVQGGGERTGGAPSREHGEYKDEALALGTMYVRIATRATRITPSTARMTPSRSRGEGSVHCNTGEEWPSEERDSTGECQVARCEGVGGRTYPV